ncbi:hypothetical protein Tco_0779658 [Tanacetum coccineum]
MSKLLDDAIGIYHQSFDFSGVRIPFSSFLLALIKHYRVYFSQLGPLGLSKVITFEVLCWSLQIESKVTLFRVFQTLCKQGDWFSFAKRCAPSLVYAMVWRHPNAAIDDPRPDAGSFNMADVRCLSAHVIKLRDMPEGVLVLSGLSHVWKSRVCDPVLRGVDGNVMGIHDFLCLPEWTGAEVQEEPHLDVRPTLQRLPFYCTPPAATEAVIPDPTPEDLAASTSGATSSHVAKRTRFALAQSSSSTTRPSLFVGDDDESGDDDDDAYVEIPLVTPLRSATAIHSSGNQGGSSVTPTTKGSNTRDSRGKGVMGVFGDAISYGLLSFSAGPIIHIALGMMFAVNYGPGCRVCPDDQLNCQDRCHTLYDGCHGGELLAPYRGLNQYHHEYVLSTDSRLKGYEEKVANTTGLELQVSALKKQVSGLNDNFSSFDASVTKSKAKGKERKKKIKSLNKSLDNLHTKVARLSVALNQANILEAERDEEILRLKTTPLEVQGELLSLSASASFERSWSMHRTKDEFATMLKKMVNFMSGMQDRLAEASPLIVTPASKSLELSTHVDLTASVVASKHNEDMVTAEVDGSDPNMNDDTITAKSGHAFVQGMSIVLDYVVELVGVGSGRVSSGPNDVVVALFVGKKGDGLTPSSVAGEKATVNPSGRTLVTPSLGQTDCRCVVVHPTDPESCHPPYAEWLPPGICSVAGQASVSSRGYILLSEADIILSRLDLELA